MRGFRNFTEQFGGLCQSGKHNVVDTAKRHISGLVRAGKKQGAYRLSGFLHWFAPSRSAPAPVLDLGISRCYNGRALTTMALSVQPRPPGTAPVGGA